MITILHIFVDLKEKLADPFLCFDKCRCGSKGAKSKNNEVTRAKTSHCG